MGNNKKSSHKKERIIMIAASAFVMAALTITGVYMKNQSEQENNDGYSIDFGALDDNELTDPLEDLARNDLDDDPFLNDMDDFENEFQEEYPGDDLDYDPSSEVDSNKVEIPGLTDRDKDSDQKDAEKKNEEKTDEQEQKPESGRENENVNASGDASADRTEKKNEEDGQNKTSQDLTSAEPDGASSGQSQNPEKEAPEEKTQVINLEYTETQGLVRPVSGEVLLPYSMNGSIYFPTLAQYKYNPAVMLKASAGDSVSACAEGQVISVFQDSEIGQAITLDLGSGYQATYGQLQNLTVSVGSHVNAGDILGYVAAPTKYFVVEGTNLYFRLTKDGAPVNPEVLFR